MTKPVILNITSRGCRGSLNPLCMTRQRIRRDSSFDSGSKIHFTLLKILPIYHVMDIIVGTGMIGTTYPLPTNYPPHTTVGKWWLLSP